MVNSSDCLTFELQKYEKKLFIGIDVSKSWIDVSMFHETDVNKTVYQQFDNSIDGFKAMIKWTKEAFKIKKEEILFCFEHTGIYSYSLSEFLTQNEYFVWLENPLQIKRSLGIKRVKNDKKAFKAYFLNQMEKYPELFPEEIHKGKWTLNGYVSKSKKQGIRLRRIMSNEGNVW